MQKIVFPLTFLLLAACKQPAGSEVKTFPAKHLHISVQQQDLTGGDVRIFVTSQQESDSATSYTAISADKEGLTIVVPKVKKKSGFGEKLVLKSAGAASDHLLHLLQQIYRLKTDTTTHFTDSVAVAYADLSVMARTLGGSQTQLDDDGTDKYKLFFEKDGQEAELYLNVNIQEHWLELSEKDPGYRAAIVAFLTKK